MLSNVFGAKKENTTNDYAGGVLPTVQGVPVSQSTTPPIQDNANTDFFLLLGRRPTMMGTCPKCNTKNTRTFVRTYPSILSWILGIGFFILCWPLYYVPMYLSPFAFLPLIYDKLKRSDHYCSKCNRKVGSVAPLSDCGVKTLA